MSDWSGFTDAELNRMNNSKSNDEHRPKIIKPVLRKNLSDCPTKQPISKKPALAKKGKKQTNKAHQQVPPAALLSTPKVVPKSSNLSAENEIKDEEVVKPKLDERHKQSERLSTAFDSTDKIKETPTVEKEESEPHIDMITDKQAIQEKDQLKLEDVHRRQKEMEERNRRKKAMLTKEIAARKKRAMAESSKLQKVQAELAKLDQLLSYDVSILRDRIDEACHEYNAAKKRFEQSEIEYIAAKMDLNKKTVMKEDLTEHLCHLIEANEERKSKKLEELMTRLDVEENDLEEMIENVEVKQQQNQPCQQSEANEQAVKETQVERKKEVTESDTLHGATTDSCSVSKA